MSLLWTAAEAAAATAGRATANWRATGVSIDTRTLQPGDLFVALKDARDGHDFVADALAGGAAAALVSRVPEGVGPGAPLLIVDDVLPALERLGRAARARTGARVVGITGSVGKTSTKDMLRTALAGQGRVHAAEKSYNNHWGVPLTLARMPAASDFAIVEIGMNHPGEIAPLARLVSPHVAIVTTVAPAHLAAFASVEDIAREKAAIFEGLREGGTALIDGDIETAPILAEAARRAGADLRRFGRGEGCHHRLLDVTLAEDTTVARARLWRQNVVFKIGAPGRHFAMNALAVLGAVKALDADLALAIAALGRWRPPAGRGTRERIGLDPVDDRMSFDLIDDAYNANPASVAAALDVLAAARPRDGIGRIAHGRRVAILGDMLEMGEREMALHANLAGLPSVAAIDVVHTVGARMAALHDALPETKRGEHAPSSDRLAVRAHTLVDAGDVVLVKGSLGSRMARVVDAIRKLGHPLQTDDRERG